MARESCKLNSYTFLSQYTQSTIWEWFVKGHFSLGSLPTIREKEMKSEGRMGMSKGSWITGRNVGNQESFKPVRRAIPPLRQHSSMCWLARPRRKQKTATPVHAGIRESAQSWSWNSRRGTKLVCKRWEPNLAHFSCATTQKAQETWMKVHRMATSWGFSLHPTGLMSESLHSPPRLFYFLFWT